MKRQPVQSSNIKAIGYDDAQRLLEVEFHSGGIYRYESVPPDIAATLQTAGSKGAYLNRRILPHYKATKIVEETTMEPTFTNVPPELQAAFTGTPAPAPAQQVPSIGRIVHYILEDGPGKGEHRPAIIVRVWGDQPGSAVQLQVFTDADADAKYNDCLPPVLWKTSRSEGDYPGSWHWPEFVPAQ